MINRRLSGINDSEYALLERSNSQLIAADLTEQ